MYGKLNRYSLNVKVENKMYRNAVMRIYKDHYKTDPKLFHDMLEGICKLAVEDLSIDLKSFRGLMNLRSRSYFKSTGNFNI